MKAIRIDLFFASKEPCLLTMNISTTLLARIIQNAEVGLPNVGCEGPGMINEHLRRRECTFAEHMLLA